jgi:hypothetical protein
MHGQNHIEYVAQCVKQVREQNENKICRESSREISDCLAFWSSEMLNITRRLERTWRLQLQAKIGQLPAIQRNIPVDQNIQHQRHGKLKSRLTYTAEPVLKR